MSNSQNVKNNPYKFTSLLRGVCQVYAPYINILITECREPWEKNYVPKENDLDFHG